MGKQIKCKFYETSAKNNINVTECFNKIAYLTYKNFLKNGFRSKSFYLKNNKKKEQKNNSKCC